MVTTVLLAQYLVLKLFIVELSFVVYSCLHIQPCALDFYKSKEEKLLLDAALTTLDGNCCACVYVNMCIYVYVCVCLFTNVKRKAQRIEQYYVSSVQCT